MKLVAMVMLGGALGSGLRYGTDLLLARLAPQHVAFPWATLAVNLIGCFAAGLLYGLLSRDGVPHADALRALLVAGFCGGLTTFSAFALQTLHLAPGRAVANIAASLVGGLALAWLGLRLSAP